jgi:hypothetical protein
MPAKVKGRRPAASITDEAANRLAHEEEIAK